MLLGILSIGAGYAIVVRQTTGYVLWIGEGEVGCELATELEEFSLCQLFLPLFSMIVLCIEGKEACVEEGTCMEGN